MGRVFLSAVGASLIALGAPAAADPPGGNGIGKAPAPIGAPAAAPAAAQGEAGRGGEPPLTPVPPAEVETVPVLKHIAGTGAHLVDLGEAHGLRSVSARSGDQFMILEVAPDGEAVVGGPELDLPVARLMALAPGQVKELGEAHGLRGVYLRNGREFQVLYVTPDGKAMIAGVMWDAAGKNLTRGQVSGIAGAIPTLVVSKAGARKLEQMAASDVMTRVEHTAFGLYGRADAPRLWVFIDPYCSYSARAFAELKPYVAAGRVQLALIPIAILDYETHGQSTPAALSLLSGDRHGMAEAWERGAFNVKPSQEAPALLEENNRIAEAISLKGTPTVIWRKADGTAGRIDGIPRDWGALIADVEEARNVSAR